MLAELGFDYIELSLSDIAALPESAFSAQVKRVERSGIACEACNNFFPPRLRLTGPDADPKAALDYAGTAIARAAQLGAGIIVFGSSGAKNVPAGFPYPTAWAQIVALLQALGPIAEHHGVTIAIEHLNKRESNIVTLAAEGLKLAREVGHDSVQLLIDYYHLTRENEKWDVISEANASIRHIHFAEGDLRAFPTKIREEYIKFFNLLNTIKYSGRCSIEAFTDDFMTDARSSLMTLKAMANISMMQS